MIKYCLKTTTLLMLVLLLSNCGSKNIKKAKEFMAAGMYDQALPLLQQEIMAHPANAEAHLLSGQIYLTQWENSKAQESFERAIFLQPAYKETVGQWYIRSAEDSLQTSEHKAAQLYNEALRYIPEFNEHAAQTFLDRGKEILQSAQHAEKAFTCFQYCLHFDETCRETAMTFIFDDVKKHLESGELERSARYILKAMDMLPPEQREEACALLHEIGMRFYTQDKQAQFIEAIGHGTRICAEYQKNDADFLYVMGKYYSAVGEHEKAKTSYQRAGTEFYPAPTAEKARLAYDELIGLIGLYNVTDMPTELPGIVNAEHERTIESAPQKGAFSFGPYAEHYPSKPLTAYFSLRIDKNAEKGKIISLDVYDARRKKVLSEKTLNKKDFQHPGEFELFDLSFTPPQKSLLEFRIFCHERAAISADSIAIVDPAKMTLTNHAALQQLQVRWE